MKNTLSVICYNPDCLLNKSIQIYGDLLKLMVNKKKQKKKKERKTR